jgi:hypothetical protein
MADKPQQKMTGTVPAAAWLTAPEAFKGDKAAMENMAMPPDKPPAPKPRTIKRGIGAIQGIQDIEKAPSPKARISLMETIGRFRQLTMTNLTFFLVLVTTQGRATSLPVPAVAFTHKRGGKTVVSFSIPA